MEARSDTSNPAVMTSSLLQLPGPNKYVQYWPGPKRFKQSTAKSTLHICWVKAQMNNRTAAIYHILA